MSQPADVEEVLISLAGAALLEAEADAERPDTNLIFSKEWRPTPRTRNPGAQSPSPRRTLNVLQYLRQLVQPSSQPPTTTLPAHAHATPHSAASAPPHSAAAGPASPPPPKPQPGPNLHEHAVGQLLKKNAVVFERLIDHPFPRALGDGSASLDGFRYYMIQDTLYLETCARIKMMQGAWASFKDVRSFNKRHKSSLEYVDKSKETLISMLGVPEREIDNTKPNKHLEVTEEHYKRSLHNKDAYFAYYIVLLPCILSYWKIAERLMKTSSKNVIYHPAWIEVNHDTSSAKKYVDYINANALARGGIEGWHDMFRISCELEYNIFETGLHPPTPYQIVPNGTYSIRSSSAAERVVIANQNVESILHSKRLGAYFLSDAGSSVVGVHKKGGENEKWHVVATNKGYTFRNVGTGHYLGIAAELNRKEGRILQAVGEPYYWWINLARSQPSKVSSLYQIHESGKLLNTLHTDMEVLDGVGSSQFDHTPVIVRENSEESCQMWSFEPDPRRVAIEKYEQILREEFEAIELLREEGIEEVMRELLVEAPKDVTVTSKEGTKKVTEYFEKYGRMLGMKLEEIEGQRRERNEKKRQELLEEVRKVADGEATRKMAELFEKYELMLQKEFETIEKDSEETKQTLLRGIDKMDTSGEVTNNVAEFVEGLLREEVDSCGQLRQVYDVEVRDELLAETNL